ncbi:MAG: YaiI/YqxD family protein [Alphaproteobacteria bacterium]|nr:YaiI/YqxD family protein [Alphaproteobacteria bacterium]
MAAPPTIFVDADACPVKEEVYRVARRTGCPVLVVANGTIRTPPDVTFVLVQEGADAADDWIAERVTAGDIVVTNDIPLASRALKAGGMALGATGKPFTHDMIGTALAQRAVMEHLRSFGEGGGGPKPFSAQDRSRFLQALDTAVQKAKRLKGQA